MNERTDIGTLIDRAPDARHNRPKMAGTGVTVRRIADDRALAAERADRSS